VKRSVVVSELASLLPFVGIALLFWLLMIRPAQRRQRDTRLMQSSLEVGDEVMLTSGIYGVLSSVSDERLQVEVAPTIVLSVARGAIGTVVPKADPDDEPSDEPADELGGELPGVPERSETVGSDPAETPEER
jgi:preprotein translocase subunit YajC